MRVSLQVPQLLVAGASLVLALRSGTHKGCPYWLAVRLSLSPTLRGPFLARPGNFE